MCVLVLLVCLQMRFLICEFMCVFMCVLLCVLLCLHMLPLVRSCAHVCASPLYRSSHGPRGDAERFQKEIRRTRQVSLAW
jgi:hypothetical protein